jgi:hypothetical protein
MSMILDAGGAPAAIMPQPNAETEQRVNHELRMHCDRSLHIVWVPEVVPNERYQCYEGRYGLMCDWHPSDKRHHDVPLGYRERWDLIGWMCEDMQDGNSMPLQPEAIVYRARELLGACDNTRHPWRRRMQANVEHNAQLLEKQQKEAETMVEDAVGYRNTGNVLIQGGT